MNSLDPPKLGTETGNAAALLAGVLDSAMDAIITVDEHQKVILFNAAAENIFGWRRRQILGEPLGKLLPARYRTSHAVQVEHFGRTGATSRRMGSMQVLYGLRASGEEFPIDASISHLDTPEGKLYTVIVRDVTERVHAQEERSAFAAAVHAIREEEKTRVARELHDELAQSLTALKMDTIWVREHVSRQPDESFAKLDAMLEMLDGAVASTRRIASDLRPLLLDDLGLAAAIDWLARSFTQRTGIAVNTSVDEDLELAEPYATAVFRIVQESLQNVAKHAQARTVRIAVEKSHDAIALEVKDDGRGFSTATPRKAQSLGIMGLHERAQLLRGTVTIDSAPGQGTRVRVHIPLAGGLEVPR